MFEKILVKLESNWWLVLILLGLLGLTLSTLIFYPGYMSLDTLRHLRQAKGTVPLIDLQPPINSLIWKFLIFTTGKVSAMLLFQLILLWAALVFISFYVWKSTKNTALSILAISIGFLPFVINISGVIWSDNQLAFALLLSVGLLLNIKFVTSNKAKIALLSAVFALLLYATLLRNNAALASAPIIYLFINCLRHNKKTYLKLILTFVLLVSFIATASLIKVISGAQHVTNVGGPMMDDIVHVLSYSEIESRPIAEPLKDTLISIKRCSEERGIIVDSFPCAKGDDRKNILDLYANDVRNTWSWMLTNNTGGYVIRKTTVYVYVLFPPEGRGYIWHEGISPNEFGLTPKFKQVGEINRMYVFNFGYKHFSYLYEPWFWLFANIAALAYSLKLTRHRRFVQTLSISSLLYFASFIPTGIAADYRYIYWPVLAALCSGILILTEKYQVPESVSFSKSITRVKKNKPNNNK